MGLRKPIRKWIAKRKAPAPLPPPDPSVPVYPIQFAFPETKLFSLDDTRKTVGFAQQNCFSGKKNYSFTCEQAYYEQYKRAYFGITAKKIGWDCLRHYEILAAGCVPYFIDIDDCPKHALARWPKDLLKQVHELPGLPPLAEVELYSRKKQLAKLAIQWDQFDHEKYQALRAQLLAYFREHLTTRALADVFLKAIGRPKHVVYCFGISKHYFAEYMRDIMLTALAKSPDVKLSVYPNPVWLLDNCPQQMTVHLYGRGFTTTRTLSAADYDPIDLETLKFYLSSPGEDMAIVSSTSSNEGFEALPDELQQLLKDRRDVVWIDGSDPPGNPVPACARVVFRREWGSSDQFDWTTSLVSAEDQYV